MQQFATTNINLIESTLTEKTGWDKLKAQKAKQLEYAIASDHKFIVNIFYID